MLERKRFGGAAWSGLSAAAVVMAAVLSASACGGEGRDAPARFQVAASIPPQGWLLQRIGGDRIRVVVLLQPGEDPHSFQPTDQQISETLRSRAYFRIGVPFEQGKWAQVLRQGGLPIRIVDMQEGIPLRSMETAEESGEEGPHEHSAERAAPVEPGVPGEERKPDDGEEAHPHEGLDPHVWLAPQPLRILSRNAAAVLAQMDPEGAGAYSKNLEALLDEIDRTEAEVRATLAPFRGRRVFVYHPAWGYFCDAFGLRQTAVESEGKDPSEAEITALQTLIRAERASTLFVQPQIAGSSARTMAEALGLKVRPLDPLAPDVLENLRAVAKAIAAGYE